MEDIDQAYETGADNEAQDQQGIINQEVSQSEPENV